MGTNDTWPPQSPHAALLSSPSGRRKFLQLHSNKENRASPNNRSGTTSEIHRIASSGLASDVEEDEDEDEETLQLKLAAIEAKLKLKKLQQNKARSQPRSSAEEADQLSRPSSAVSGCLNARPNTTTNQSSISLPQSSQAPVEIPLSPRKQIIRQTEQRSPGRVLLGIDKGITGADVSLRRARSLHASPAKFGATNSATGDRPSSRLFKFESVRSSAAGIGSRAVPAKSFSERMSEARDTGRSKESKRDAILRARGAGLKLNEAELESYKLAAEEASKHNPPRSPKKERSEIAFSRDEILQATDTGLRNSRTLPDLRPSPSRPAHPPQSHQNEEGPPGARAETESTLYEPFSNLNLSSRILPNTFLKRTLPAETFTTMRLSDLLKQVTSPAYELPDSVIDFAVFGVIASKSSPMDHKTDAASQKSKGTGDWEQKWEDGSQNQRKFMVLQLTDLKWSVDVFLFGTAVPRYHRLSPGTVVAILNPSIMPPKKGREDTGAFSLTLHNSDDVVLEIGISRDFGLCKAVKKDGKECGTWVNASKTEICEFHLNLQVAKSQSGRMGVNAGSNGFGRGGDATSRNRYSTYVAGRGQREDGEGRGLLPRKQGPRYDRNTGSQFYIASASTETNARGAGAPKYRPERSTAHMLDQDDGDPFVAEGQLSRDDKEGRMRKRLEVQAKERIIADKLVAMGSGGAGGEYLRHRSEKADGKSASETGSQRSAQANRNAILGTSDGSKGNGKRLAESVRLSPIKKTRFLTEKGIKIAGRESIGTKEHHDDDDELDIV